MWFNKFYSKIKRVAIIVMIILVTIITFLTTIWDFEELKLISKNSIAYFVQNLKNDNRKTLVSPVSEKGFKFYSQGGITNNNYAYFSGSKYITNNPYQKSNDFSYINKFELIPPFRTIKTYDFEDTYDSSPFLIKGNPSILIAHEYKKNRTKALNEQTGDKVWISKPNQIGALFFGYNLVKDVNKNIFIVGGFENGLSIISSYDGKEKKFLKKKSSGGVTPAVNELTGDIFYQFDGGLLKSNINNDIIKEINVDAPNKSFCWNTIYTNDNYGEFIITYWMGEQGYLDSAIRVFDSSLNLIWEKLNLPGGKKNTITYFNGKVTMGIGNGWNNLYNLDNSWKKIPFYNIRNGEMLFYCDLSNYNFGSIPNVPVVNNLVFAETQDIENNSQLFIINGNDGEIMEIIEYDSQNTSCAPSILSGNYFLSGDLHEDQVNITKVFSDAKFDWEGPFGPIFSNTNSIQIEKANLLKEPIIYN